MSEIKTEIISKEIDKLLSGSENVIKSDNTVYIFSPDNIELSGGYNAEKAVLITYAPFENVSGKMAALSLYNPELVTVIKLAEVDKYTANNFMKCATDTDSVILYLIFENSDSAVIGADELFSAVGLMSERYYKLELIYNEPFDSVYFKRFVDVLVRYSIKHINVHNADAIDILTENGFELA